MGSMRYLMPLNNIQCNLYVFCFYLPHLNMPLGPVQLVKSHQICLLLLLFYGYKKQQDSHKIHIKIHRHPCWSNQLPGWLSGHLENPPTNRSWVDSMKLLFLSKLVYWNTSNSWDRTNDGKSVTWNQTQSKSHLNQ